MDDVVDPNVEHVGVSRLRQLDRKALRNVEKTIVIQDNKTPLAVLLSYERYLIIQNQLKAVMETIEVLSNPEEAKALLRGLEEAKAGRSRNIDEIRRQPTTHLTS